MAAGASDEAANAIQNARNLNIRYAKSQELSDALKSANLRTGSTGTGGNIDNTTRQNFRRLLENGNWTPDEKVLLEKSVMGTVPQNVLRQVGRFSPIGNALMGGMELGVGALEGYASGGFPSAITAIPAIGTVAKAAADNLTKRNSQQLMATILAGGKQPAAPPVVNLLGNRAAVAAALAGTQQRR